MRERFHDAVEVFGGRAAVAEKLGCSTEFIRRLENGDKTPGLALALRIEKVLKIEPGFWARKNKAKKAS